MDDQDKVPSLVGLRTYLMGAGIIIHQVLKQAFGIDAPNELWSSAVDVILGVGVLYYRYQTTKGAVIVKKEE